MRKRISKVSNKAQTRSLNAVHNVML